MIGGGLEDILPDGVGGYATGDRLLNFENIAGSAYSDQLFGNNLANALSGGAGSDFLYGDAGTDTLDGGAGGDWLFGDDGADRINGGSGNDVLAGGSGNDVFVFTDLGGRDTISDFRRGQDKIDLSDLDADSRTEAVDAFRWIGSRAFSGSAGELQLFRESGEYFLRGDVDGDKLADFVIGVENAQLQSGDIFFG